MRVMHTVLEGTPDELSQLPQFTAILADLANAQNGAGITVSTGGSSSEGAGPGDTDTSTLPGELDAYIADRGRRNPARDLIRQLAAHAISTGHTCTIGESKSSPDGKTPYFAMHAPGPQRYGAVAYVHPVNGRTTVRLTWDDPRITDELRVHVFRASERPANNYAIGVMVNTDVALAAVKTLIGHATDTVRGA